MVLGKPLKDVRVLKGPLSPVLSGGVSSVDLFSCPPRGATQNQTANTPDARRGFRRVSIAASTAAFGAYEHRGRSLMELLQPPPRWQSNLCSCGVPAERRGQGREEQQRRRPPHLTRSSRLPPGRPHFYWCRTWNEVETCRWSKGERADTSSHEHGAARRSQLPSGRNSHYVTSPAPHSFCQGLDEVSRCR